MSRRCRQSGAAVVELAVLLLVLVPILLAALFVGDAVRFRLDVQQVVTSTAWDHAVARWDLDADGKKPGSPGTRPAFDTHARKLHCDHSIAHDRTGRASYDCGDRVPLHHRRTLAAHLLWSDEGGSRWEDRGVRCSFDRRIAAPAHPLHLVPFAVDERLGRTHDRWTFGGKVSCEATAWLYNYVVPGTLFPEFTGQKLAKLENLHGAFDGGAGVRRNAGRPHLALTDRFAILTDTWASEDFRDRPLERGCRAPGGEADHGVLRRVEDLWSGGDWLARDLAFERFLLAHNAYAAKNEFVRVRPATGCREGETVADVAGALFGSDPSALVVSLRHPLRDRSRPGPGKETLLRPSGGFSGSPEDEFYTAPWDVDGVSDRGYSSTFANRGPYYLGCTRPGGC